MIPNEDILNAALKFLATHGARGNSFDFYDKRRAEWNGYTEYLFKYLYETFGITEEEGLTIINHLYELRYIDAVWEPTDSKEAGHSPNQIKITYKGLMKADSSKLTEMQKPENIEAQSMAITNLQVKLMTYQVREYESKKSDYWRKFWATTLSGSIGALLGAMLSITPLLIQEKKREEIIVLPKIQIVHDTIFVEKKKDTL